MGGSDGASAAIAMSSDAVSTGHRASHRACMGARGVDSPGTKPSTTTSSSNATDADHRTLSTTDGLSSGTSRSAHAALPARFAIVALGYHCNHTSTGSVVTGVHGHNVDILTLRRIASRLVTHLARTNLGRLLPCRRFNRTGSASGNNFGILCSTCRPNTSIPGIIDVPTTSIPTVALYVTSRTGVPPTDASAGNAAVHVTTGPDAATRTRPSQAVAFYSTRPGSPVHNYTS